MDRLWCTDCNGKFIHAHNSDINMDSTQEMALISLKNIIIKWGIILFAVAILLTFALVWPPREYKLVKEDGKYYAYLDQKYVKERSDNILEYHLADPYTIRFDSLEEMENDLRHGRFTVHEFYKLGRNAYADGKVAICNIDALYQANFPTDLQQPSILFQPADYYYCTEAEDGSTAVTLWMVSQESFQDHLERHAEFENTVQISAGGHDAHTLRENAYVQDVCGGFECYYIITSEQVTYYVLEDYHNCTSKEIPSTVYVYARTQDGAYFLFTVRECTQRPDISWLASFSVQPHS